MDVAGLIKAAGSPEAVIQYLLKEKQSQAQQNAQLWRLVDKQRAMILGLNKDLERALKDKEKYRKKLKEIVATQDVPPVPAVTASRGADSATLGKNPPRIGTVVRPEQVLEVPVSPTLDSDSQKHSPIDVTLAPYPITPPADQPNGPPSAMGEILDPQHAMPKSHEHALDQFDHEEQERQADAARKATDDAMDLPLNLALPPSRSVPSKPPQGPPPRPPPQQSAPEVTSNIDDGLSQFPAPPAPPPRKPPPAPLQLRDAAASRPSPTYPPDEDVLESDSDFDELLEVTEITQVLEKRGRRKTREEDDRVREILAIQEAERRSLSKKSKKSSSAHGTPKTAESAVLPAEIPPSPRAIPSGMLARDNIPASLAGMLSGDTFASPPPLLSPGLPSSPRPMGLPKSPLNSPPLSPRGAAAFAGAPLSPRPPRQPIPLPPNTPLMTPSVTQHQQLSALDLKSPKPLTIIKKGPDSLDSASPTQSITREIPTERTRIYRGLVTDEYPDLLLAPNALPSIDIKVASSRMKPSRASLLSLTQLEEDPVFTLAIFSRSDGGELWRVEKDSVSLAKLDQRLKQCAAFTARTPDRSLFSGHAPAKLDARRKALNAYLDELLDTPLDTATAVELCKYLSSNTLPPNADETGISAQTTEEKTIAPKEGPGGRPLKSGYLTKRGKNFGGWKARFFVLDGPQLKYFETPGGAHLGTIKLQNAQIGKQSQQNESSPARQGAPGTDEIDNQYRHAFLILEPKKKDPSAMTKHVLCAESDHERDQWVETLLRWIDFRDPDDEGPEKKERGRQPSSESSRAQVAGSKKKPHGPTKKQQPETADALIAVGYENTRAGDAPSGVPPHSATLKDMGPQTMSSQSPYTISAPSNPQVISSGWNGKMGGGLAPPSQEEKKARKRSFFGFGTKNRTSTDGGDSLFDDNGTSSNSAGPASQAPPQSQVFGAPLAEAVRFHSPVDVRVPLPAVVFRCIQYLEAKNAVLEEGIFRLSGSNVVIKGLRERFNNESDVNLVKDPVYHDIHAVASLLKLYLRELPTTILTRDLHMEFLAVTEITSQREKLAALNELAQRLPQANATLLKYLIAFLIKIINNSDMNKMTVRNVGIVFSPTLNIPAPVFAMLLQNYEAIFGIEPEEYELPSPVSDPGENRVTGRRPSVDHAPPRPSTSQANSSPHRQRQLEQVKNSGAQNPETPPPMVTMAQLNYSRTTPTPPPQTQQPRMSYEPSYLAQQNAGPSLSSRPAYESGFVVPQGFDPSQLHTPTGPPRANPGYDRPIYEQGGYDGQQQYGGMKTGRRGSIAFNTLNSQASQSRLREETQFPY